MLNWIKGRKKKALCVGIGVPLVGVLLIGAVIWLWPGALRGTIESRLAAALGGPVSIGAMEWEQGDLQLSDVSLRAEGLQGPVADILHISSMRIDIAPGAAFTSDSMLEAIYIETARVLVAGEEGAEEDRLNLSWLSPPAGGSGAGGGGGGSQPPSVRIDRLDLEVGTFDGVSFTQTGKAGFKVELQGEPDGGLRGTLQELDVASPMTLHAHGVPGTASVDLEATGVRLDDRTRGLIPFPRAQQAIQTLALQGDVPMFKLSLSQARLVSGLLVLDDMSLRLDPNWFDLPGGADFWVAYEAGHLRPGSAAPLMRIDGGRIEFEDDRLTVSTLRGSLVSKDGSSTAVPWAVDLDIHALMDTLAGADDLEQAMHDVAFELRLSADQFRVEQDVPVVLPERAARILELFGVQSGLAGIRLVASTSGPEDAVDISGLVNITDARGAYEQFPYPLTGLNAEIEFDLDQVHVRRLHADGRHGSTLSINGQVETASGNDIDLDIEAKRVPIDGVFLSALPDVAGDALRDVLPPDRDLPLDSGAVGLASGSRVQDIVDLDLHVHRSGGGEVEISGRIDFDHLEVQWQAFPWPVLLDRGWFDWTDGVLTLHSTAGQGVGLRTPDGVIGHIDVMIDLPPLGADPEEAPFEAQVALNVRQQPITGALREAVRELTSEGGELLQRTQLSGLLDLDADIHLTTAVPSTFNVRIDLRNGLADAAGLEIVDTVTLADLLGATDCHVDGTLHVQRDSIQLEHFRIQADDRLILLSGAAPGSGVMQVDARDLHAGEWVARLLPPQSRTQGMDIAHRWEPEGRFSFVGTLDGDNRILGAVTDAAVTLHGFEPPISLRQSSGAVRLNGLDVSFDDVLIGSSTQGRSLGTLAINGSRSDGVGALRIVGTDVELASGLVFDLVPEFADPRFRELWVSLDLAGTVDLETRLTPDSWRLLLRPKTIAATRNDRRFMVSVHSGDIELNDAGLTASGISCTSSDGVKAFFDGRAQWEGGLFEGRFQLEGSLRSALVGAMVGPEGVEVLDAISLSDGGRSRVTQGRIDLRDVGNAPTGLVDADIKVTDARLEVGVELDRVDARARLELALRGDAPPALSLSLHEATAMFGTLSVDHLRGQVTTDSEGVAHLESFGGDFAGGRLSLEGQVEPEAGAWSIVAALAGARLEALSAGAQGEGHVASGRIETTLRLAGRTGSPESRRGSGAFRIVEGDLGPLPVAVGLQQLLQLSSPIVDTIDFAQIDYHIDGESLTMDDIVLESTSGGIAAFSMRGSGKLDWKTLDVDLRLRPRGGWLVIGDILGALQDQLYEVSVTGSLVDPEIDIVPLPGLTRSD
ncbi:MAG: AsmA-like C-terminal region-containing protein [Phycisphaerales bacterium]|nr:AsmA-like C-terminal region-containing protein [Phycisphaerales bacterium]